MCGEALIVADLRQVERDAVAGGAGVEAGDIEAESVKGVQAGQPKAPARTGQERPLI
jgi:hypothetical protein